MVSQLCWKSRYSAEKIGKLEERRNGEILLLASSIFE